MEHSLLVSFLDGKTSALDFGREIKAEVDACEEGIQSPAKRGNIVITDGPPKTVTRENMARLLHSLLDGSLSWAAANYTGDCLMMGDDFEPQDIAVSNAIWFVADDSRQPTSDETRDAIKALGNVR